MVAALAVKLKMYDFIFNVQPQVQKILFGQPWDSFLPPLVGSFLAIVVSVTIAAFTIKRNGDSNRRYIEAVEKSSREHIEAVEKASANQIIEERYWRDLKRKLLLNSLSQEFIINHLLYISIVNMDEKKDYKSPYSNFNLAIFEKCLADSPINNNAINFSLSAIYRIIKSHDNKISASRSPLFDEETRKFFIEQIAKDYKENSKLLDEIVEQINAYEQSIELHPLPDSII
jgi:hypothetical protein